MHPEAPILEFDPAALAILNPPAVPLTEPSVQRCVLCFFQDVIDALKNEGALRQIGRLRSEIGDNPIYLFQQGETPILLVHPGVGAPLAAGFLEELIALGVNRFIACGGCGVLDQQIAAGHPVILQAAVRDEGTSYHYLPPAREVSAHPQATAALQAVLEESGLPFLIGKAWTTDAIYRETNARRAARLQDGCQVVEMEAAAFFAVAQFRQVIFGQVVYGGDLVVPEGWDGRGWHKRGDDRALLLRLALSACARLA
jgi:nucleoside phosphorylase